MSHGGGGGGKGWVSSDPNLTPLLDLVLQLVMYFMLVANFVMDELSDKIHLPVATQAKPLTAKDTNIMYLNVSKEGKILLPIGDPLQHHDRAKHLYVPKRMPVRGLRQRGRAIVTVRKLTGAKLLSPHKDSTASLFELTAASLVAVIGRTSGDGSEPSISVRRIADGETLHSRRYCLD